MPTKEDYEIFWNKFTGYADVDDAMKDMIYADSQFAGNRTRRAFYASDAFGCERKLTYSLLGYEPSDISISEQDKFKMDISKAVEYFVIQRIKHNWPGAKVYPKDVFDGQPGLEWKIGDIYMNMYMDALVYDNLLYMMNEDTIDPDTGEYNPMWVIEVKAPADSAFKTRKAKDGYVYFHSVGAAPYMGHYFQIEMYMYVLWKMTGVKPNGFLIYVNKNDGAVVPYHVKLKVDFVEDVLDYLEKLYYEYIAKGKLPPRPHEAFPNRSRTDLMEKKTVRGKTKSSHWECLHCQYKSRCWGLKSSTTGMDFRGGADE